MKKEVVFVLTLILIFTPLQDFSQKFSSQKGKKLYPKNVIIMIGDGMGIGHISSLILFHTNANIAKLKNIAIMSTYAYDSLVTDSAAGGTALATGYKTKNGYISVSVDGQNLETIFEVAKKKAKATGIVVTSSITHATPAVFYAHVPSRNKENEIALFMTNQIVDIAFGGGLSYFFPSVTWKLSVTQSEYAEDVETNLDTTDTRKVNLLDIMEHLGYIIITNYEMFRNFNETEFRRVLALFESVHLFSVSSGKREISLAEMTRKALNILSKHSKGFVVMIEGSQIDWESHGNNFKGVMNEMKDFDDAIGVVLEFVSKNPDTLLIITADHETGGMFPKSGVVGKVIVSGFGLKDHTATFVPVFSVGPGSELLKGFIDNTFVGQVVKRLILEN